MPSMMEILVGTIGGLIYGCGREDGEAPPGGARRQTIDTLRQAPNQRVGAGFCKSIKNRRQQKRAHLSVSPFRPPSRADFVW